MDIKNIFGYVKDKYDADPEYLWTKYPDYAVFRHKDNKKWFAIIMDVEDDKLGLEGSGIVNIIDLKCDPVLMDSLLLKEHILPGYHMNKKYWISVIIDENTDAEMVYGLIDMSFEMTRNKKKAR